MQASQTLLKPFQGEKLRTVGPTSTAGPRQALRVLAYKKGGGKVKGGYNGTEPNAKKGFCKVDASGRKSKGLGAYRFTKKYGDVNDYSPIYDEFTWSQGGDLYALGSKGLTAWGAFLVLGLTVSVYLIVTTSQL